MMFCQDHWDRLRDKIAAAGLSALVAESGGLVHIMTMADCPLCHANAAHAAHCTDGCGRGDYFDDYLDFAVADQVAAWKRLGDDG